VASPRMRSTDSTDSIDRFAQMYLLDSSFAVTSVFHEWPIRSTMMRCHQKKESEPTKDTTAGVVPELAVDNGSHHDKDKDVDTDSS
jgi:hypothetical protein